MRQATLNAPPAQLDFFAAFDSIEQVIETATAAQRPARAQRRPHPAGHFLIWSAQLQCYWSNDDGWIRDPRDASAFPPEHVCAAQVVQWRRDGRPIHNAKNHWHWLARAGGLAGHRGADFDGPYPTEQEAREAALAAIGPGRPLVDARDAEYILASKGATA